MSAPAALSYDFGPYEGPLGDRAVSDVHPHLGTSFSIEANTPRLRAFEAWLRRHPIYVRVPGEKYLIYGMKAWPRAPGDVVVLGANLLLSPSEQPLGPWEPDGGDMLSWAFSVMDHYELGYRPESQFHRKTRQQLIDWYHSDSVPVDWQAVAERLRATGRPVPDDLFDEHD